MPIGSLAYAPFDLDRDDDIRHLFNDYRFKDHQLSFMGVSKERMVAYLKKTLKDPETNSICMNEGDQCIGLISIKFLPWMSRHFGFRMFTVSHLLTQGNNPLIQARLLRYVMEESSDVDFLDCRVAIDDVHSAHALEICGFRYVGTEIYLGQKLTAQRPPESSADFEIRPFLHNQDAEQVLDIAGEIHVHNRFMYDPFVDEKAARSMYKRLVSSCFDHYLFNILVAEYHGRVEGFIISKLNPSYSQAVGTICGSLDFIGVRPESRTRGLGKRLNRWALHTLAGEGVSFVAVRTMGSNYPALMTCQYTGFRVTSSSLHFHKWITRPKVSTHVMPSFESLSAKMAFPEPVFSFPMMQA